MNRFRLAATAVALATGLASLPLLTGCDGAVESAYNEQLVVAAFLYTGQPIDSVVIHRTTPFGSYYEDLAYAVDSADVTVTVDGVPHHLLPGSQKGRYYLPASELVVQGGKTYQLTVTAPNWQTGGTHTLRASTVAPMPVHFDPMFDSLRGQTFVLDTNRLVDFQFVVKGGPVDDPNRRYMLGVESLDTTQPKLPVLPGPPVDTLARIRYSFVQTGPILPVSPRLFAYYGPNRLDFLALDTNWVDYQRQVLGPNASYQPTLNHIEGGMGVFASAARDTLTVFIKPKD